MLPQKASISGKLVLPRPLHGVRIINFLIVRYLFFTKEAIVDANEFIVRYILLTKLTNNIFLQISPFLIDPPAVKEEFVPIQIVLYPQAEPEIQVVIIIRRFVQILKTTFGPAQFQIVEDFPAYAEPFLRVFSVKSIGLEKVPVIVLIKPFRPGLCLVDISDFPDILANNLADALPCKIISGSNALQSLSGKLLPDDIFGPVVNIRTGCQIFFKFRINLESRAQAVLET